MGVPDVLYSLVLSGQRSTRCKVLHLLYGTFLYLDIMNPVQLESSNTCRTFCVFSELEIGRAELNKADRRPQNPFHEEPM